MSTKRKEMIMTREDTDRLIEYFEEEEDLWNISSENYHKKEKRSAALERIKEKLEDKFDVAQIAEKLRNLRSNYAKELAKTTSSKKSGAGTDEVYKSKWPYFDSLDSFLRVQIVPRKSVTNFRDSTVLNDEDDQIDEEDCTESQQSTQSEDSRSTTPICRPFKKRKVTQGDSESAIISEAASVLAQIKKSASEPSKVIEDDANEDMLFCKYLAKELGKVTDQRTKAMLKMKFQNLLFEAQFAPMNHSSPQQQYPQQHQQFSQQQMWGQYGPSTSYNDSNNNAGYTYTKDIMNLN